MSYCRFQNTVADLRDCYDNFDEIAIQHPDALTDNDQRELRCREQLIKLCVQIALDYGQEVGTDVDIVRPEREAA